MFGFIKRYLLRRKVCRDQEYKDAVHYAYQHFAGDELDHFLDIIDSIYDDVELMVRKRKKN